MYKLILVVLALVAVAASQYVLPYAYNTGLYRTGYYNTYSAPIAYSGLGYRTYGYGYPYIY